MTELETKLEANLIKRSTEVIIIKSENKKISEVQKISLVITSRKESKRIVKLSAKIVKAHTQRI